MDHHLSHEYAELQKTVAAFAHDVIAPVIGDLYEARAFPYDIVRQMGEMGLFGLPIPEEYGGMGGDYFALCLTLEEIARVDSSVAITLEAAVSLGAMPIYRFGTEEQKRTWLPRLVTGDMLGAFGLTEPGGGTDAGAARTTARLDGDEWVINGTKSFITNSGTDITGFVAVLAITGEDGDGVVVSRWQMPPKHACQVFAAPKDRQRTEPLVGVPLEPGDIEGRMNKPEVVGKTLDGLAVEEQRHGTALHDGLRRLGQPQACRVGRGCSRGPHQRYPRKPPVVGQRCGRGLGAEGDRGGDEPKRMKWNQRSVGSLRNDGYSRPIGLWIGGWSRRRQPSAWKSADSALAPQKCLNNKTKRL